LSRSLSSLSALTGFKITSIRVNSIIYVRVALPTTTTKVLKLLAR